MGASTIPLSNFSRIEFESKVNMMHLLDNSLLAVSISLMYVAEPSEARQWITQYGNCVGIQSA